MPLDSMPSDSTPRSTEDVFEDHLRLRLEGRLEEDLARNYADDVVLMTSNSNWTGHDAIRISAARLRDQLPDGRFEIIAKKVHGRFALLIWRATSDRFDAVEGSDSFVVEDGKIRLQTIHYGLVSDASGRNRPLSGQAAPAGGWVAETQGK